MEATQHEKRTLQPRKRGEMRYIRALLILTGIIFFCSLVAEFLPVSRSAIFFFGGMSATLVIAKDSV